MTIIAPTDEEIIVPVLGSGFDYATDCCASDDNSTMVFNAPFNDKDSNYTNTKTNSGCIWIYEDGELTKFTPPNKYRHATITVSNSVLQSRTLDTTWSQNNSIETPLQNQTGYDGLENKAWYLEDAQVTLQCYLQQNVTVDNDSLPAVVSFRVKKDNDQTRFPDFGLQFLNGTTQYSYVNLNTETGEILERAGVGTRSYEVIDDGDWWKLNISVYNNSTGNTTVAIQIFPARGTVMGTSSNAAVGTIIVDTVQLELGTDTASPYHVETTTAEIVSQQYQVFGHHVDISDDGQVIVAGARGEHFNTGAFYILRKLNGGNTWQFAKRVVPSWAVEGSRFGFAIAIGYDNSIGKYIIVAGAPFGVGDGILEQGRVITYSYDRFSNTLEQLGELFPHTNLLLQSRNFNSSSWTQNGTPVLTQNQTGFDGTANKAWTIEDDDTGANESIAQSVTITASTKTVYFSFRIKKDSDETRFPYVVFSLPGVAYLSLKINTAQGTGYQVTHAGTPSWSIEDDTNYWKVICLMVNDGTGTAPIVTFYPAVSTVFMDGSIISNTLGSCVIDAFEIIVTELNSYHHFETTTGTSGVNKSHGYCLDIAKNASMIVTSSRESNLRGTVNTYSIGSGWNEDKYPDAELVGSAANDYFGISNTFDPETYAYRPISISPNGNWFAIGAHGVNSLVGAAYIYNSSAVLQNTYNGSVAGAQFATAVNIYNDYFVVGEQGYDIGAATNEGAFHYTQYTDSWGSLTRHVATASSQQSFMSYDVYVNANYVYAVASDYNYGEVADLGAVYKFTYRQTNLDISATDVEAQKPVDYWIAGPVKKKRR